MAETKRRGEQPTSSVLRLEDKQELTRIAAEHSRSISWLIADMVRRVLATPILKAAFFDPNPATRFPLVLPPLGELSRAKLQVLAQASNKTIGVTAWDLLDASLILPAVKAALVAAAQAQLRQDPANAAARQVLAAYNIVFAPAVASPTPTPAPATPPVPVSPVAAEPQTEPVEQPLFALEDIAPDGDLSFLAPPSSTPAQRPIARAAYAAPPEKENE